MKTINKPNLSSGQTSPPNELQIYLCFQSFLYFRIVADKGLYGVF